MISDINVFCYLMKHRVDWNGNCTCVITKDGYHFVMNTIVADSLSWLFIHSTFAQQPAAATYSASAEDIAIDCCFLALQHTLPIHVASCIIRVWVSFEIKPWTFGIVETKTGSALKISHNPFDSSVMRFFRIRLISCTQADWELNIRPWGKKIHQWPNHAPEKSRINWFSNKVRS